MERLKEIIKETNAQSLLAGRLIQLNELMSQGIDVSAEVIKVEQRLWEMTDRKLDTGRLFSTNRHP